MAEAKSLRELAIAIYTVNRHAKTAPDNRLLYQLKKVAIAKLLETGGAEKVGLHFVENPRHSKQHSTVLVRCGEFLFHTLPEKEDFAQLPHLGEQDMEFRNPQERMSLKAARDLLTNFTGILQENTPKPPVKKTQQTKTRRVSNTEVFRSSYLDGKH
ncbi:YkyB family protein [Sporosarcina gallistercoris]|uniref:YkyB family protein n=1 Tax=Sporosarcina gallistercoris TaxID=2762245 RepID=UPI003D2A0604